MSLVQIHKQIVEILMQSEFVALQRMVDELTKSNMTAKKLGYEPPGFTYMAKRYTRSNATITRNKPTIWLPLHLTLYDKARDMRAYEQRITADKEDIEQMLYLMTKPCTSLQELRDAIPDCVVPLIERLRSLERVRPYPYYHIEDNPKLMKQYYRVLPKIEAYSVTHLIY